jgi:hypothetical protein
MPFAFGMQNTLVKFYLCKTEDEQDRFYLFSFFSSCTINSFVINWLVVFDEIATYLSKENPIVKEYLWLIPLRIMYGLF